MFDFTLRDRQTDAHMVLTIYIRILLRSQTHTQIIRRPMPSKCLGKFEYSVWSGRKRLIEVARTETPEYYHRVTLLSANLMWYLRLSTVSAKEAQTKNK